MRYVSERYILQQKCVNGQNKYEFGVVVIEVVVVVPVDGVVGAVVDDDETAVVVLPVDGVVGAAVGVVDDVDVGVEVSHSYTYCLNPLALNVVSMSLMFVCTMQTTSETSTATQVDISKHLFRQSESDV